MWTYFLIYWIVKLFNITDIFNNIVTMSPWTLEAFHDELRDNFKLLIKSGDIDNLRILRNRLHTILENNDKKISRKESKKLKKLNNLLRKINESIEKTEHASKKEIELEDLIAKHRKKNKARKDLPKNKKDTHVLIARKKSKIDYEEEMLWLQMEMVKLQSYIQSTGRKLLIIFEGRDAAGKWGNIKRFMENLNPRYCKVVALTKPSEVEKWQWYFQRYVNHLPNAGEIILFDRSWYNRAWVEPVMGFVGQRDYQRFIEDVPVFEKMLTGSKIKIIKFYFSVSKDEQAERFHDRSANPLKQYKLSAVDQFSQKLWDRYTLAEYLNFSRTDSDHAPWTIIQGDDKERARINALKHVLNQFDYPDKIDAKYRILDENLVYSAKEKVKILEREIDSKKSLFE